MRAIAYAALLLCAGVVFANDGYITARKIEPARLPELARILDQEMQVGGRFAFVTVREREQVEAALADMATILRDKQSTTDLTDDERVRLLNAQERANAILTRRDGERLICERRTRVGTHHRDTVCETYAERMKRLDQTQEAARRANTPRGCIDGNPGCVNSQGKAQILGSGGG